MPDPVILKQRSKLLQKVRAFFHDLDFIEVQTPSLSRDTIVDQHIDPIPVELNGFEGKFYLQTSPEFAMKRLLISGCQKIFEITSVFRDSESGAMHNPEFTMLEWYRVGDSYESGMELLSDFVECVFEVRAVKVSYREWFESLTGLNPHLAGTTELGDFIRSRQITFPETDGPDRDLCLELIVDFGIESELKNRPPTILFDWPETQPGLARLRSELDSKGRKYKVAERFELYISGIELANGYHELCDPEEQSDRQSENNARRVAMGKSSLPSHSRLAKEMREEGLPPSCGVAVGFDRMMMVLAGKKQIEDVISFPIDLA